MNKIYITGCAKSGTTLLRRLMNAFNITVYNEGEMSLEDFTLSDYQCAKRTHKTIFSNALNATEIKEQVDIIEKNNISIINIWRDFKDVIKSDSGYVSLRRWQHSIIQSLDYNELIAIHIHYTKLIENPDDIQQEIADKIGLKILHKWSEFPDWYTIEEPEHLTNNKMYRLRRIGESKSN